MKFYDDTSQLDTVAGLLRWHGDHAPMSAAGWDDFYGCVFHNHSWEVLNQDPHYPPLWVAAEHYQGGIVRMDAISAQVVPTVPEWTAEERAYFDAVRPARRRAPATRRAPLR